MVGPLLCSLCVNARPLSDVSSRNLGPLAQCRIPWIFARSKKAEHKRVCFDFRYFAMYASHYSRNSHYRSFYSGLRTGQESTGNARRDCQQYKLACPGRLRVRGAGTCVRAPRFGAAIEVICVRQRRAVLRQARLSYSAYCSKMRFTPLF